MKRASAENTSNEQKDCPGVNTSAVLQTLASGQSKAESITVRQGVYQAAASSSVQQDLLSEDADVGDVSIQSYEYAAIQTSSSNSSNNQVHQSLATDKAEVIGGMEIQGRVMQMAGESSSGSIKQSIISGNAKVRGKITIGGNVTQLANAPEAHGRSNIKMP